MIEDWGYFMDLQIIEVGSAKMVQIEWGNGKTYLPIDFFIKKIDDAGFNIEYRSKLNTHK